MIIFTALLSACAQCVPWFLSTTALADKDHPLAPGRTRSCTSPLNHIGPTSRPDHLPSRFTADDQPKTGRAKSQCCGCRVGLSGWGPGLLKPAPSVGSWTVGRSADAHPVCLIGHTSETLEPINDGASETDRTIAEGLQCSTNRLSLLFFVFCFCSVGR